MREARLTDGCRDILRECEADTFDPWSDWSDEEFADFERRLNSETERRYAERLRQAEAELGPLELTEPW